MSDCAVTTMKMSGSRDPSGFRSPSLFSLIAWGKRICSEWSHQPAQLPSMQAAVSALSNLKESLPGTPKTPLKWDCCFWVWVDETWSHSARWWLWHERASHLDLFEQNWSAGYLWLKVGAGGARGRWSSGLVRTNMSTYGQMMQCDVSPGHVQRTWRAMTWIHVPWRRRALQCLSWISIVYWVMFIGNVLDYTCRSQHLTWFKLT